MAGNPNPSRVTDALWYFAQECLELQPGTENGGTYAPKYQYHDTRDHIVAVKGPNGDYSVRLQADREGPGDKAAAFDWTFPDAQAGRYGTIIVYGQRVRAAWAARDPRLYGFREVLIQADPDGNAEGYDFTSWSERTPDSTHLWHGHFSVLRRYLNDKRAMQAMLSILAGESLQTWQSGRSRYGGELMALDIGEKAWLNNADKYLWKLHDLDASVEGIQDQSGASGTLQSKLVPALLQMFDDVADLREAVASLQTGGVTEEMHERVMRRILGGVDGAVPPV